MKEKVGARISEISGNLTTFEEFFNDLLLTYILLYRSILMSCLLINKWKKISLHFVEISSSLQTSINRIGN